MTNIIANIMYDIIHDIGYVIGHVPATHDINIQPPVISQVIHQMHSMCVNTLQRRRARQRQGAARSLEMLWPV